MSLFSKSQLRKKAEAGRRCAGTVSLVRDASAVFLLPRSGSTRRALSLPGYTQSNTAFFFVYKSIEDRAVPTYWLRFDSRESRLEWLAVVISSRACIQRCCEYGPLSLEGMNKQLDAAIP